MNAYTVRPDIAFELFASLTGTDRLMSNHDVQVNR
jgi:hypothetical protein